MKTVLERFESKYSLSENGCWLWAASKDKDGYGLFNDEKYKTVRAHRFSYQLHIGEIPPGMVIDHLCRNESCVNPEHLEPVSNHENVLRGKRLKKICKHGTAHTRCLSGCLTTYHREYKRKKALANKLGYN